MGEFDYRIVADGSSAEATNKRVDAGLDKITTTAANAGRAIEGAFGSTKIKDSSTQFLMSSYALQQVKERVDKMNEAWQHEEDVLERIKGPARDHEREVTTLNSLYSQGKITLEEYTQAYNRSQARTGHGGESGHHESRIEGIGNAVAGQFGEVGGTLSELSTKGTVAAASLVGVGYEVVHLSDEYAHMENAAIKLADGTRATNDVLDEQLALAGDLHGSLEATMELSDAVNDRTQDLNLTNAERLRLTQSLGDAAVLENKSLGDAASVMSRVGFALESGIPAGRAMKDLLREYPVLADVMREHLHMSTKAIIEMADKGQLSMEEFARALRDAGPELDEKMGNRVVGLGTKLGHMKDKLVESKFFLEDISNWIAPGLRETERYNAALESQTKALKKDIDSMNDAVNAVHQLEVQNSELTESINRVAAAMDGAQKLLDDGTKSYTDARAKVDQYGAAVGQLRGMLADLKAHGATGDLTQKLNAHDIEVIRGYRDAQQDLLDQGNRYGKIVQEIHKHERERRDAVEDLTGALKHGVITQRDFYEEMKKYQGEMSEEEKVFHSIQDPIDQVHQRIHALNELFRKGRLDVDVYLDQMDKAADTMNKLSERSIKSFNTPRSQGMLANFLPSETSSIDTELKTVADRVSKVYLERIHSNVSASDAFTPITIGASGSDGVSSSALKSAQIAAERSYLNTLVDGQKATEKFAEESRELDDAERRNVITTSEHATMLGRLRDRYNDVKTPQEEMAAGVQLANEKLAVGEYDAERYARALAKLHAQYDKSAGQGFENGLQKIHDEMLDVSSVAEKTLTDAFHGVEDALVEMATTGKADFSKMIDSMLADLARLALRELEMSIISSFSSGPELPKHDLGASWTVGGSGGADTSLQAFWASPGETVTVTPSGGSSSSRRSNDRPIIVENHNHFDRRELLSSMRTYDGRVTLMNEMRSNPGALRTLLQK